MASLEEKTGSLFEKGQSGSFSPRAEGYNSMSKLNKAPQDFVVTGGVTYKVVRSSYDKPDKYNSGTSSSSTLSNTGNINATSVLEGAGVVQGRITPTILTNATVKTSSTTVTGESEVITLRNALNEAEAFISRQTARIEELERYLLSNCNKLGGESVLQTELGIHRTPDFLPIGAPSKLRLGLAARRRAESLQGQSQSSENDLCVQATCIPAGDKGPSPSSATVTPMFASAAIVESGWETHVSPVLRRSRSDGEVNLHVAVDGTAAAAPDASPSNANKMPPKGLAARLTLGSEERRRLAAIKRMSTEKQQGTSAGSLGRSRSFSRGDSESSTGTEPELLPSSVFDGYGRGIADISPVETPKLSRNNSSGHIDSSSLYQWDSVSGVRNKLHLFVAHDNPQLGNTVHMHLRTDPSGSMGFMMETKHMEADTKKELTCFIVGEIAYSGPFEGIQGAMCLGEEQRGSLCLVCTNLRGYKADIKAYPTQPRGEVIEIDLSMGCAPGTMPKHQYTLDTEEQLKMFLKPCTGRVDFILDPSHTGLFYPYWEGRRKMAPQFRSKGVGYLRLGDDMSNYGTAFLSLDAGNTYLDNGATSIVNDSAKANSGPGFSSTFPGAGGFTAVGAKSGVLPISRCESRGSQRSGADDHDSLSSRRDSTSSNFAQDMTGDSRYSAADNRTALSARDIMERQSEVRELLTVLRDPDLKWGPRSQHLGRLRDLCDCFGATAISCGTTSQEQADMAVKCTKGTTEVISVLTETILRQNNPQVLRNAISCLRTVADSAVANPSSGVAWRQLLLEVFHLLRSTSKPIYEEVKDTLDYLHSHEGKQPGITLTQLTPMLSDIFNGPRGKGTPRANGADKSGGVNGAANTKNVVLWFITATQLELTVGLQAFTTMNSSDFSPSCYERIDIASTFSRCQQLLQHREEATREAVVGLIANLIALDVVQYNMDREAFVQEVQQAKQRFTRLESSPTVDTAQCAANLEASLLRLTSEKCGNLIQEVARNNARMYEKLIPMLIQQLESCANTVVVGMSSSTYGAHSARERYSNPPSSRGSSRGGEGGTFSSRAGSAINSARHSPGQPSTPVVAPSPAASVEGSLGKNKPNSSIKAKVTASPNASQASTTSTPPSANIQLTSTDSPVVRRTPDAMPPRSPLDLAALKQRINDQWFEARLILRSIPNTESAFRQLADVTNKEIVENFSETLTAVASCCGMPRGALLRVILPFDENTSSNDQSAQRAHTADSATLLTTLREQSNYSPRVIDQLREQAINLRRTIRVKMADEADLRQALAATKQLQSFCKDVEIYAKEMGKIAINVIADLE